MEEVNWKMQKPNKPDTKQKEIEHKNIVSEYLKLIAMGRFEEGLHYFASTARLTTLSSRAT
jgi:hypothetical protein